MENLINIKCTDTTYLCNTRPNSNFYNDEDLLVGVINNNFQNYNLFKSFLRFYIPDLSAASVKNIYLYLYLENVYHVNNNHTANISVSVNDDDTDISTINWLTCPKRNNRAQTNVNVPIQSTKKYTAIDITDIIRTLNSYTNIYNIIIEPLNFNSSFMVQFNSNNSKNPPYLVLINDNSYNEDSLNNSDNEDPLNDSEDDNDNSTYINEDTEINESAENQDVDDKAEFDKEGSPDEITGELNTQNSRLEKLEQNFSSINNSTRLLKDYVENLITQKNSSIDSLSNLTSNLDELIKTELHSLKNSVNNDVSELKSSNDKNLSDLNNAIRTISSEINNNIDLLKAPIENLLDQTNSSMESILNDLIKTEIDALKNSFEKLNPSTNSLSDSVQPLQNEMNMLKISVNNDISELHSYVSGSISNLGNSIKDINETLSQLSTQVSKISENLNNIIIDPINDNSI